MKRKALILCEEDQEETKSRHKKELKQPIHCSTSFDSFDSRLLHEIPREIFRHVTTFLDHRDILCGLYLTCKDFNQCLSVVNVWKDTQVDSSEKRHLMWSKKGTLFYKQCVTVIRGCISDIGWIPCRELFLIHNKDVKPLEPPSAPVKEVKLLERLKLKYSGTETLEESLLLPKLPKLNSLTLYIDSIRTSSPVPFFQDAKALLPALHTLHLSCFSIVELDFLRNIPSLQHLKISTLVNCAVSSPVLEHLASHLISLEIEAENIRDVKEYNVQMERLEWPLLQRYHGPLALQIPRYQCAKLEQLGCNDSLAHVKELVKFFRYHKCSTMRITAINDKKFTKNNSIAHQHEWINALNQTECQCLEVGGPSFEVALRTLVDPRCVHLSRISWDTSPSLNFDWLQSITKTPTGYYQFDGFLELQKTYLLWMLDMKDKCQLDGLNLGMGYSMHSAPACLSEQLDKYKKIHGHYISWIEFYRHRRAKPLLNIAQISIWGYSKILDSIPLLELFPNVKKVCLSQGMFESDFGKAMRKQHPHISFSLEKSYFG